MKRLFLAACVLILLNVGIAAAQTPAAVRTIAAKATPPTPPVPAGQPPDAKVAVNDVQPAAASAANSWMGAQLGYKFGNNSHELGDNLLVSGSVTYDIPLADRKFHLPVISNFADLIADSSAETEEERSDDKLKELAFATSGIRVGLYPYREVGTVKGNDVKFLVHGEGSWKYNGFKDDEADEVNYLSQFRIATGFEMEVGLPKDDAKPLTLSVTPVLTLFNSKDYLKIFDEDKSHLTTLEVVAVVPISKRTGVLFEYIAGDVRSFRAGVIVAAEK